MTTPVALIYYDHLLKGSQLGNRLADLGYRIEVLKEPARLAAEAEALKPLIVVAHLGAPSPPLLAAVCALKDSPATAHIPVLVLVPEGDLELPAAAREAGATLVASQTSAVTQLPQMLEQALRVD